MDEILTNKGVGELMDDLVNGWMEELRDAWVRYNRWQRGQMVGYRTVDE